MNKKRPSKNILNNDVPGTEPWGTPDNYYRHEL